MPAETMIMSQAPTAGCQGCSQALLRAVPVEAIRILQVGCGEDDLGAALMRRNPSRQVFGMEIEEPSLALRVGVADHRNPVLGEEASLALRAGVAERRNPELVEEDSLTLRVGVGQRVQPGSVDCIVYGDVLGRVVDPEGVLRRQRRLLTPGGTIVCCVPNVQHHSVIAGLLQGDFQCTTARPLDATPLRF